MNSKFLRQCIIDPVLYELSKIDINFATNNAALLLMETCAVESNFGMYIGQLKKGVALGIWQIEPNTYDDLFINFIKLRPNLLKLVNNFYPKNGRLTFGYKLLQYNHQLNCLMARLVYWRIKDPLPETREGRAQYWKKYYNTYKAKGTVKKYLQKSARYLDNEDL